MKTSGPQEAEARSQARDYIKQIMDLHQAYHRRLHKDREGALAVLDELDALVWDTDDDEPGFVSYLLVGGNPQVRLRVQQIGRAPGPATLEAQYENSLWFRVPMGRNQKAAAHWFASKQSPFTHSL
jgi:hypothetical protein